jgi:hypothetical protein
VPLWLVLGALLLCSHALSALSLEPPSAENLASQSGCLISPIFSFCLKIRAMGRAPTRPIRFSQSHGLRSGLGTFSHKTGRRATNGHPPMQATALSRRGNQLSSQVSHGEHGVHALSKITCFAVSRCQTAVKPIDTDAALHVSAAFCCLLVSCKASRMICFLVHSPTVGTSNFPLHVSPRIRQCESPYKAEAIHPHPAPSFSRSVRIGRPALVDNSTH